MTDEEIMKMCKSLARRYKNYTEYEDLVSEGLLAIYEWLDKEPFAMPARLYRVASTRMHDYLNIQSLAVTVPVSDVARTLARNINANVTSTWSHRAVEHLRATLVGGKASEDMSGLTCPSSEELYITEEQNRVLQERVKEDLTSDEQLMLYMRYVEGMSQQDCASFFGKSQTWLQRKESVIYDKIRKMLANMQHYGIFEISLE